MPEPDGPPGRDDRERGDRRSDDGPGPADDRRERAPDDRDVDRGGNGDGDRPPEDGDGRDPVGPEADPGRDDGARDDRAADRPAGEEPGRGRPSSGGPRDGDPSDPRSGTGDDGSGEDPLAFLREVARTVGVVVLVGLVLFGVSGVWPPLVAVESGSMEPHMFKGDLVFLVEEGRFAPADATEGVVTRRVGRDTGYWSFGDYGNVVVYRPHVEDRTGGFRGEGGPPVIHRAQFYVEAGEDWVAQANDTYLGSIDDCREVSTCPAPHDGFVTKGDNNARYDQATGLSTVVKREWIRGTAKFRLPWLGCVRLQLSGDGCF
jgi:signal peptidase